MRTIRCGFSENVGVLADLVQAGADPVLFCGDGYDSFVAMSSSMLEGLLFGTVVLESIDRDGLRL